MPSDSLLVCLLSCVPLTISSQYHQAIDAQGIHDKICALLAPLRGPLPIVSSEDDRLKRNLTIKMSQHALIDLCKKEASKFLVIGKYELAVPGALQSLRFSMEVYGDGRIELVPSYLLLAEANLGVSKFKLAEEFLTLANWNVLKNPNCSNVVKSQLYRLFGKLYASQGNYSDALLQLAHDIYYSSLEAGPEHIDTAGGYYYLASVFLLQEKIEHALANFDKVIDIWYKFLINLRQHPQEKISDYLGEAQIGEATEMMKKILETRSKYLSSTHIATGEAAYSLAILLHIVQAEDATRYYSQAFTIYNDQLGSDHESTLDILNSLESLGAPNPLHAAQVLQSQQGPIAVAASTQIEAKTAVPELQVTIDTKSAKTKEGSAAPSNRDVITPEEENNENMEQEQAPDMLNSTREEFSYREHDGDQSYEQNHSQMEDADTTEYGHEETADNEQEDQVDNELAEQNDDPSSDISQDSVRDNAE